MQEPGLGTSPQHTAGEAKEPRSKTAFDLRRKHPTPRSLAFQPKKQIFRKIAVSPRKTLGKIFSRRRRRTPVEQKTAHERARSDRAGQPRSAPEQRTVYCGEALRTRRRRQMPSSKPIPPPRYPALRSSVTAPSTSVDASVAPRVHSPPACGSPARARAQAQHARAACACKGTHASVLRERGRLHAWRAGGRGPVAPRRRAVWFHIPASRIPRNLGFPKKRLTEFA